MQELAYGIELNEKEKEQLHSGTAISPCTEEERLSLSAVAEGLLFVVGEDGLSKEQLSASLEAETKEVEKCLSAIGEKYAQKGFGIELVNYAGRYKFISKQEVFPYAQRLFRDVKPDSLSQSALETLAIIAYKQPVTRVEIEELRGVGCEMMLRKLLTRNLIREAGRSEAPGRPILYEVTEEFLDSFALETLAELPELPQYDEENIGSLYEQ